MPPTEDYPEQGVRWLIGEAKGELRNFQWRGAIREMFPDFDTYFEYVMGEGQSLWDDAISHYRRDQADLLSAKEVARETERRLASVAREKAEAVWLARHSRPMFRSEFKHRLEASKAVSVYVRKQPRAHPWKPETWYGPESEISVFIDREGIDPDSLGISES